MTAREVIEQIKHLPSDQRESVLSFVRELDSSSRISGSELNALAEKFSMATKPEDVAALREDIVSGFYGRK